MATCTTRNFGALEYGDKSVIRFPAGLPGFENEREFVFIQQPQHRPLLFLQSLSTPRLCFVVVPVLSIDPDYELQMRAEDLELIGFPPTAQPRIGRDVFCGAIVSAGDEDAPTANLRAPVVIALQTLVAVQAIQEEMAYSHCHRLEQHEMVAAC